MLTNLVGVANVTASDTTLVLQLAWVFQLSGVNGLSLPSEMTFIVDFDYNVKSVVEQ